MNWGKGIAIGMAAFIIFIVTLVTIIMSKKVDLETDNYYQKESNLNGEIIARKNWIEAKYAVSIEQDASNWKVQFSKIDSQLNAEVSFKHAVNEGLDFSYSATEDSIIVIPKNKVVAGIYKYQLKIKTPTSEYLTEGKYRFQ